MDRKSLVTLTISYGDYGQQSKSIALPISEDLARELMGRVELSDDPFSVLLASPGMYGGKGDAVTIRRKAFKMRREVAEEIARAMIPAMMQAFGVNDELDGYNVERMSPEERAYHAMRGRLPPPPHD